MEHGPLVGLVAGLGFVATSALQAVPVHGRSWLVYASNVGYTVAGLVGIGLLLSVG